MNILRSEAVFDCIDDLPFCVVNRREEKEGCSRFALFHEGRLFALASGSFHYKFTLDFIAGLSLVDVQQWTQWTGIARKCGFKNLNQFYDFFNKKFPSSKVLYIAKFVNLWTYEFLVGQGSRAYFENNIVLRVLEEKAKTHTKKNLRLPKCVIKNECIGTIYNK